jgi:hypothetical protein
LCEAPLPASGEKGPPRIALRILSDGRAGHEAQAIGVAEALGLRPDIRRVAPRGVYEWIAPFGPPDPRDAEAFAPPYPDIAFAAGRRTLPALARLKHDSGGATFAVYFNAPAIGLAAADLIVAPRHDRLSRPNVIAPLTPPNRVTRERLAAARAAPDPRIDALPRPLFAMLIGAGGRSLIYDLDHVAATLLGADYGVMATPSRRTPPELRVTLSHALSGPGGWFWDGEGENPYFSMLAKADHVIVTGDSVNMVGEAVATGAPVHVIEPFAARRKITAYLAALEKEGAIRIWRGPFPDWTYEPINSTPMVAEAVARAYAAFRSALKPGG